MPQQALDHHLHVPEAPRSASYEPIASYDQMLAFLVKMRTMLKTPCLESMNYIFANQEPFEEVQVFMKRLDESYNQAILACKEAHKRTKEVAGKFQQAWDLVDVKDNAVTNHTSPPNKPWQTMVLALAFELKEAVKTCRQIRWDLNDAESKAEQWEASYVFATDQRRRSYHDVLQLRDAYMAIHKEFMAGQSLAEGFMEEVEDWIKCDSESARVWSINQALRLEEERESEVYGARSRFKKRGRGSEVAGRRKIFPSSYSVCTHSAG